MEKFLCRTFILNGKEYIHEDLVGNLFRCYEGFHMKSHMFIYLCERLKTMNKLHVSRNVNMEEDLVMGLSILYHRLIQRVIAERFQHSLVTVAFYVKNVLREIATLGTNLIKLVNRGNVQPEIQENLK